MQVVARDCVPNLYLPARVPLYIQAFSAEPTGGPQHLILSWSYCLYLLWIEEASFSHRPIESAEDYDIGGYYSNAQENLNPAVKALEATTGRVRWQYRLPERPNRQVMGGLLSTAGGLIFGGDNETFFALNAETGAELWHIEVGGLLQPLL